MESQNKVHNMWQMDKDWRTEDEVHFTEDDIQQ